ncbi:kinase-like domain, phloem protein 2-like protein [Tanacetum coccineum]
MMSSVNHEDFAHLKIPLEDILTATKNFADEYLISKSAFPTEYWGNLLWSGDLIRITARRHETRGSLNNYLSDPMLLTWMRRLEISVGLAQALSYIHYDEPRDFSVIHRNISSATVQLNDNWEPKLSDFERSMKIKASKRHQSFQNDACPAYTWYSTQHKGRAHTVRPQVHDLHSFGIYV